jgi:hypothetical protein
MDFMYLVAGDNRPTVEDVKFKFTTPAGKLRSIKPDWLVKFKLFVLTFKGKYNYNIFMHEKYTQKQKRADIARWNGETF